jgi:acyl-CoA thioesterase-1
MVTNITQLPFKNGERILFQGDSITDTGRRRDLFYDLGQGYVAQVSGLISTLFPELKVEILNRGNSGNRSSELIGRWQTDCIDLHPDWLSLFIGVNDVWRKRTQPLGTLPFVPLDEFLLNCRTLLDQAKAAGVAHFVLVSPTLIDKYLQSDLNQLLEEYDAAVQELAKEYGAIYVPARQCILKALANHPEIDWLADGCHPTTAGHAIIAAAWLKAVADA